MCLFLMVPAMIYAPVDLTANEYKLLCLVMENLDQVLSQE